MDEELISELVKKRRELVDAIREKLSEAGGPMAVAKRLGYGKANLWYHLNYNNPVVNNIPALVKISETVAQMVKERQQEAIEALDASKQQLLNA